MRESMKEALKETFQGFLDTEIKVFLTEKRLKKIGVVIPASKMTAIKIKKIRKKTHLSQVVFAKVMNVSPSSVRKWEQGERVPSGSTSILLELVEKKPHILDYRLKSE